MQLQHAHTRTACLPRVRPFTSAVVSKPVQQRQHHVARAAAEAVAEETPSWEVEEQAEEVYQGRIVLDEDAKLALRTAESLMEHYELEAMLEGTMADGTSAFDKATIMVESSLEGARGNLSADLDAAASVLASYAEAATVAEVEDYQGPQGFRKYDEQEEAAIPEEAREAVQRLKLTRQELSSLVPQDWATVNVEWFSNKKEENIPLPDYKLTFLWQLNNIAVAVDQVYSRGQVSPLTEYFVWPRKDAWEELKSALESRPSVSERDKVILLNRLTEVINFWQQEPDKPSIEQARASFPDCAFA